MNKFFIIFLMMPQISYAVFEETPLLLEIVANTASTAADTLALVEKTQQYADSIQHYNSVMMKHYYLARRIERQGEELALLSHMDFKDWKDFNYQMRSLKSGIRSMDSESCAYVSWIKRQHAKGKEEKVRQDIEKDLKETNEQELLAGLGGKMSDHIQLVSINTAGTNKRLTKISQQIQEQNEMQREAQDQAFYENAKMQSADEKWLGLSKANNQVENKKVMGSSYKREVSREYPSKPSAMKKDIGEEFTFGCWGEINGGDNG